MGFNSTLNDLPAVPSVLPWSRVAKKVLPKLPDDAHHRQNPKLELPSLPELANPSRYSEYSVVEVPRGNRVALPSIGADPKPSRAMKSAKSESAHLNSVFKSIELPSNTEALETPTDNPESQGLKAQEILTMEMHSVLRRRKKTIVELRTLIDQLDYQQFSEIIQKCENKRSLQILVNIAKMPIQMVHEFHRDLLCGRS